MSIDQTTNRKWCMAYWIAAIIPMTLSDLEFFSLIASLFKWDYFVHLCSSWQDFSWRTTSQGPSAIAGLVFLHWVMMLRWPSVSDFLGQSRFLMMCPGKKSVLRGRPFVQFFFWLDVPICPSLQSYTYASVAKKSSDCMCMYEKIAVPDPDAPPDIPRCTPDGSHLWRSHPTIRAFDARPGLRCPNYGHPKRCVHNMS